MSSDDRLKIFVHRLINSDFFFVAARSGTAYRRLYSWLRVWWKL